MKKQILIYGVVGGMISWIWFIIAGIGGEACFNNSLGYIFGYATILLSMTFVFFGVRAYRNNVKGGFISFGRALGVALLITLASGLMYTIGWMVIQSLMIPDFYDRYAEMVTQQLKASGASAEEIAAQQGNFAMFDNPFLKFIFTFLEPLPVGILVSLITAIIVRKKNKTAEAHS